MRFLFSCLFMVLAFSAMGECNIFKHIKHGFEHFGHDVDHVAHEVGHGVKKAVHVVGGGVKKGAGEVAHIAQEVTHDVKHVAADFAGDVKKSAEQAVKHLPHDIAVGWDKAKPFLEEAFTILNDVSKPTGNVKSVVSFLKILAMFAI